MRNRGRLVVTTILVSLGIGTATACPCKLKSPAEAFEQAPYVFTGAIVEADRHLWRVAVDRVWKGGDKVTSSVRLMDAHAATPCESAFELGRTYLFFAALGKGVLGKDPVLFFHPRVCSWTSLLRSRRFVTAEHESLWIEDLIVRDYGPGSPPGRHSHE